MRSQEKTRGPTSDEGVKRGGAQEGRGEESARLSAYEDLSKLGKDKWGGGVAVRSKEGHSAESADPRSSTRSESCVSQGARKASAYLIMHLPASATDVVGARARRIARVIFSTMLRESQREQSEECISLNEFVLIFCHSKIFQLCHSKFTEHSSRFSILLASRRNPVPRIKISESSIPEEPAPTKRQFEDGSFQRLECLVVSNAQSIYIQWYDLGSPPLGPVRNHSRSIPFETRFLAT